MKTRILLPAIFLTMSLFACQKDSMVSATTTGSDKILDSGTCDVLRMGFFSHNGTDHTFDFTSYTFQFCPDHTVTASTDLLTIPGTWSKDQKETVLTIAFNDPGLTGSTVISQLNGDWSITEQTKETLGLERNTDTDHWVARFDRITR